MAEYKPFMTAALLWMIVSTSMMMARHACGWTPCQNVCGDVPVMYPFGTGRGCGSKVFESYVNCTKGKLQLYTPTGQYEVQKIDYTNNVLIIQDPKMSTCSSMQESSSFGLPVDAPFAIAGDTFVLLGCSSTSSGSYNTQLSSLCDPTGTQICQSLYSCSSISQLGFAANGPTSSCCVYSNPQLNNPPYQLNLQLLQCSSYTSIYSFGTQFSYGSQQPSDNYQNPNSWSYGIALKFYYDQSAYYASCKACQQSNGVCAFNVYGFVCVCSAGVNTTTRCFGNTANLATGSLQLVHETLRTGGLAGLLGIFFGTLF